MLALTRHLEQSIIIDLRTVDLDSLSAKDRLIYLKIIGLASGDDPALRSVRIGFTAARTIPIHRSETFRDIEESGRRKIPRHLGNAAPKLLAVAWRIYNALHDLPERTREGEELLAQVTEALMVAEPSQFKSEDEL